MFELLRNLIILEILEHLFELTLSDNSHWWELWCADRVWPWCLARIYFVSFRSSCSTSYSSEWCWWWPGYRRMWLIRSVFDFNILKSMVSKIRPWCRWLVFSWGCWWIFDPVFVSSVPWCVQFLNSLWNNIFCICNLHFANPVECTEPQELLLFILRE